MHFSGQLGPNYEQRRGITTNTCVDSQIYRLEEALPVFRNVPSRHCHLLPSVHR